MCPALKSSKYNRAVEYRDKWLLFNGVSSGLLLIGRSAFDKLRPILFGSESFSTSSITDPEVHGLWDQLVKGRFIIEEFLDELEYLRERFHTSRHTDSVTVTIATTLDCNLGCYYCYEDRERSYLSKETCDGIFSHVERLLNGSPQKSLHVSWYGGEPMLHVDAIEYLSTRFIEFCSSNEIRYRAHMVTNGTCWPTAPDECVAFVNRHKIRHIQFSFDGLTDNHNKRRHYLQKDPSRASSFDALCRTVSSLIGHANLYLRMNVDRGNLGDAYPLVDFFHQQGWLYPGSKVFPYVAPLLPHTSACSSVSRTALDYDEINAFQIEFRRYLSKYCDLREFINMNYYPRTVRVLCGAVASRAVLFGPDGRLYKCVYDLGVHSLSHAHLHSPENSSVSSGPFTILADGMGSPHDYMNYDPCSNPSCSKCEYLPICMGGCPKVQIERNNTDQFKRYWDANLDTMLRTYADVMLGDRMAPLESLKTPFGPEAMNARRELEFLGVG